jgi:transposase
MPIPLSNVLRERFVAFVEAGHWRRAAAAHFRVSASFVVNLMIVGTLKKVPAGLRCRRAL